MNVEDDIEQTYKSKFNQACSVIEMWLPLIQSYLQKPHGDGVAENHAAIKDFKRILALKKARGESC